MLCDYGCGREAKFPPRKGMTKWCCEEDFTKCPEVIKKSKGGRQLFIVKNTSKRCSFECGKKAKFRNKKGTIWCCEDNINSCPAKKQRSGDGKKGTPSRKGPHKEETKIKIGLGNKGKVRSEEIKQHWSKVQKLTVKKIQKKYKLFCKEEKIKEGPKGKIFVKCQYCDTWFEPNYIQLYERIRTIEKSSGFGAFLYCSDYCKNNCICYNLHSDPCVLTKYLLYLKKVQKETNISIKNYGNNIVNLKKRGRDYHLDHKHSIFEGFKNDVDPKIIGHWKNLEIISGENNERKGKKCSITLEELLKNIKQGE